MQLKSISRIVVLGVLVLIGMLVIQAIWLKDSLDSRKNQFTQNVQAALRASASAIIEYNGGDVNAIQAVEQLSSNYFVVPINDAIQPQLLKTILVNEFKLRSVEETFEFSIYDCSNEKIVFGSYITQNEAAINAKEFPEIAKDDYYFSVLFPNISFQLINQMSIWLSSSVILVLIVIIYSYTLVLLLKQKSLSEFQRDFINNMTHEFKTPLASISASSEMIISEEMKPERLKQYASIIYKEADRLTRQVEKFLNLSVMEERITELNLEQLNLTDLLEDAKNHFASTLTQKYGQLTYTINLVEPMITTDKVYISNCLFNLLDNALKYTDDAPRINVKITTIDKASIVIEISDNGFGIKVADQANLFDRFYRVSTGDLHNVKGFGLGLYYVKLMAKTLGGDVYLKKSDGLGSVFVLKVKDYGQ
ncbi:MAG: two-component system phosphate regulon sensor histidine kinase PhoR [Marivirga sp.]|jgi:two-component system phosphate regulon sensor histidine kinase PhoR